MISQGPDFPCKGTRGQDFSDKADVIEDLNPLFDGIMATLRANQIKKPKRFIGKGNWSGEEQKYPGIYAPFGLPVLWAHWWMVKSEPVRRWIARKLDKFARKLQRLAAEIS